MISTLFVHETAPSHQFVRISQKLSKCSTSCDIEGIWMQTENTIAWISSCETTVGVQCQSMSPGGLAHCQAHYQADRVFADDAMLAWMTQEARQTHVELIQFQHQHQQHDRSNAGQMGESGSRDHQSKELRQYQRDQQSIRLSRFRTHHHRPLLQWRQQELRLRMTVLQLKYASE